MSKIRLFGDTSGYVDLTAPAVADNSALSVGDIATESYADSAAATTFSPSAYANFAVAGAALTVNSAAAYTIPLNVDVAHSGITLNTSTYEFNFAEAGVYMFVISYRVGPNGGDVWTNMNVYNATTGVIGKSAGYGNAGSNDPGLYTPTLMAVVSDPTKNYVLRLNRAATETIDSPSIVYGVQGYIVNVMIWRVA